MIFSYRCPGKCLPRSSRVTRQARRQKREINPLIFFRSKEILNRTAAGKIIHCGSKLKGDGHFGYMKKSQSFPVFPTHSL